MRRMTSGSTCASKRAVAPAARRHRAETSLGRKPRAGPRERTESRIVVVIKEDVTVEVEPKTLAMGVPTGAECCRRYRTRRMRACTGQRTGSPLHAKPMTSPRTPFFCVVKVSDANRACCICSTGAVKTCRRVSLMNSCTSCSQNGSLSLSVYSPGRRRKKNATMIMSAVAQNSGLCDSVVRDRAAMRRTTEIGIGLTRRGARSVDFQALRVRCRWKLMLFAEF